MKFVVLLSIAACAAAPTLAAAESKPSSARDPNRVICRTEPVVGSRLAKTQRCMSAAEWAEMKRLDRQALEKSQNRDQRTD